MKVMIILGIVLIVLSILALVYQGIPGLTQRDTVNIGPIQTTVETKKTYVVPPIVSGLALAGGVILVVVGLKKKS